MLPFCRNMGYDERKGGRPLRVLQFLIIRVELEKRRICIILQIFLQMQETMC